MFLIVVPWRGEYKVILTANLAVVIVPAERRAGTKRTVISQLNPPK